MKKRWMSLILAPVLIPGMFKHIGAHYPSLSLQAEEMLTDNIKDKLKKAIKDGLSEDNEKDAELELQKLHDKFIKKIDDILAAKNKEIMTV